MRTMHGVAPTTVFPARASILTSPLLLLAAVPAVKNGMVVPFVGTARVSVLATAPEVPVRNPTAPPPAADTLEILMLTAGGAAPAELVMPIRQGDGAQVRNCAAALVLLLICSWT